MWKLSVPCFWVHEPGSKKVNGSHPIGRSSPQINQELPLAIIAGYRLLPCQQSHSPWYETTELINWQRRFPKDSWLWYITTPSTDLILTRHYIPTGLARAISIPMKVYTHEVVTLWYRSPGRLRNVRYCLSVVSNCVTFPDRNPPWHQLLRAVNWPVEHRLHLCGDVK